MVSYVYNPEFTTEPETRAGAFPSTARRGILCGTGGHRPPLQSNSSRPARLTTPSLGEDFYFVAGSLSLQSSTIQIESTVRFGGGKGRPRSAINFLKRAPVSGRATAD